MRATMSSERPRGPLPVGYRQGVIMAITVLLGFSLVFLRFWNFELPGDWNVSSALAAILLAVSILGQLMTLWRSLQLEDDDPPVYRKTLRWRTSLALSWAPRIANPCSTTT